MLENNLTQNSCVIIGASHGGANLAFMLRNEGWQGDIILIDKDPNYPYHRPPLSKTALTTSEEYENLIKPSDSYAAQRITLLLGRSVEKIDRNDKSIELDGGEKLSYDKLVLATGARPIIPPIKGISETKNVFALRTINDVSNIRRALIQSESMKAVIIGGGYIGLEIASSLRKIGTEVTILEREQRVLSRVTTEEMSTYFEQLHRSNGVKVLTNKNIIELKENGVTRELICNDQSSFQADVVILGAGVKVNSELAEQAGLESGNGIVVDEMTRTSDEDIHAIGDCTLHFNPHYGKQIRLESIQNAVDQAKIAAAGITGKDVKYDSIPWFWSDQYDIKLQMVGLADGHDLAIKRTEGSDPNKFSIWYFKEDELLAVDAINNAKAYVLGTKFIKEGQKVNKEKVQDPDTPLKPMELISF